MIMYSWPPREGGGGEVVGREGEVEREGERGGSGISQLVLSKQKHIKVGYENTPLLLLL